MSLKTLLRFWSSSGVRGKVDFGLPTDKLFSGFYSFFADCTYDSFQYLFFGFSGMIEIPALLKVHPEIGCAAEESRQPQCGCRGDASFSVDDFIDPLKGHMYDIGEHALCDSHWYEEFLEQHLSGMRWNPVCRYTYHGMATLFLLQRQATGGQRIFPVILNETEWNQGSIMWIKSNWILHFVQNDKKREHDKSREFVLKHGCHPEWSIAEWRIHLLERKSSRNLCFAKNDR